MLGKNLIVLLMCMGIMHAQDFFDDASDTIKEDTQSGTSYELNGFMRGVFFGGNNVSDNKAELKSGYGELGIKMRARKAKWGDGYAEVRFRRGLEFDNTISEFSIREAYVNAYLGNFDIRLGQQIVVWGRADGFNPTNNITPQNMLARSPDEDDRRDSNFLMRIFYYINPVNIEFIWVPQYLPSVLPTGQIPLPLGVTIEDAINPDAKFNNSSIALKADLELSSFDGSVSYFHGYMPLPSISLPLSSIGFDTSTFDFTVSIRTRPYKMDVIGFDFSTTLASLGIRGEVAYRKPVEDHKSPLNMSNVNFQTAITGNLGIKVLDYIPNPDIQYVLGVDKTKGDFSIIVQYIGRYVIDFNEFQTTGFSLDELILKNRMITSQQDEISHSVFMRPVLAMYHETMDVELLGYYNITTEEVLLRPVITYDLADALTLRAGAEWYSGPDNTLFGTIEKSLSSLFIELRASF